MIALQYEYLIRAAFNCDRDFRHGADADIYRSLQHAEQPLGGQNVSEYQLGTRVGQISAYVSYPRLKA